MCVLRVWDGFFIKKSEIQLKKIDLVFEAFVMEILDLLAFTKNLRNLKTVWYN